jgi:hypothetical protein
MYLEFVILIWDYLKTLNVRKVLYEILIPLIPIIITIFFFSEKLNIFKEIVNTSIDIIGILLGFSIATITIFITGNGKNIDEMKSTKTNIIIGEESISLYRLILINFGYSIVIEILFILLYIVTPLFCNISSMIVIYSIMVYMIIHVLLVTLRNMTDFYLIMFKK